jgi:ribosomal protein S18 acetylase RimI-like enzyme
MTRLDFDEVKNDTDIGELAVLADGIWHEFCPTIQLSAEQIDYMVEKFQSFGAIKSQIESEGYRYFLVKLDGKAVGYYGVCKKEDGSLFLSKLYLEKSVRRKGLASLMFKQIKRIARQEGCEKIWLTVNRHNDHAIAVYKKFGMRIIREECTDIGSGFVMDDFVVAYYV